MCCHLKSGAGKGDKRSDMMSSILRGISCDKIDKVEPDSAADFCFLFGDFNFRFKSTFTNHIEHVAKSKELIPILDEFYEERVLNSRWPGFQEMPITFNPTYKREAFSYNYVNKKDQCPSYTDRSVIKSNDYASVVELKEYGCREKVMGSDHRPVYLDLSLGVHFENFMCPLRLMTPSTPH